MKANGAAPVVFQPGAARGLHRGIDQIVEAIRPTLGPRPRLVAVADVLGHRTPELLDDGGIIARRITELPDRDADMGAMLVRGMLWRLHEQVGDGTATAAVLFRAIYERGLRYVAAGGNATRLRQHLDAGMNVILDDLARRATPLQGRTQIARLAASVGADPALATLLGEIFDIIGEWGQLEIRTGHGRELEREYVEGMYWDGGVLSSALLTDTVRRETRLESAAILITDLAIADPHEIVPALELARQAGARALVIVARAISDEALTLLLLNRKPPDFDILAVGIPDAGPGGPAGLRDLALLTGGRPLLDAAGDSPRALRADDLGRARRAWANNSFFGIVGGKGDPHKLRQHIAGLRAAFDAETSPDDRAALRRRIGRLLGGSATLWVGAASELALAARKAVAERAATALRGAIREGVLPGGGAALLACRPSLVRARDRSADPDERAAYGILIDALAEPCRVIVANSGYDVSAALADIERAGAGYIFDVTTGSVVDALQAGIVDSAPVLLAAAQTAIASAALALTIDVLVHHRQPEEVYTL